MLLGNVTPSGDKSPDAHLRGAPILSGTIDAMAGKDGSEHSRRRCVFAINTDPFTAKQILQLPKWHRGPLDVRLNSIWARTSGATTW
jgi:hypothetical protein